MMDPWARVLVTALLLTDVIATISLLIWLAGRPTMTTRLYRSSVAIVVRRGGKFLAVNNRRWGGISLPGGKIEEGESPEEAAARELLEETGCKALSLRRTSAMIHDPEPKDDGPQWVCVAFEADVGDQEPRASEDGTTPFWATEAELVGETSLHPAWNSWYFSNFGPCRSCGAAR